MSLKYESGRSPPHPLLLLLRPHNLVNVINLTRESEFFIDNLLVRIHFAIEMILVDRPRAMGV